MLMLMGVAAISRCCSACAVSDWRSMEFIPATDVNQREGFACLNELLEADWWDAGCYRAKACARQLAFDLHSLTLNS